MRGKKVKMLRAAAIQEADEIGANERKIYKQFKSYYSKLATSKAQQPKPGKKPRNYSLTKLGTSASPYDAPSSMPYVIRPMKFIRARIKDEYTTIGNLTSGLVDYIKKAPRILTKTQLDTIALGGRLA